MAPKRFKKLGVNEESSEKYKKILVSDVICPICRSILVEPVTLPCNHGFCLACFNSTMENATLTCPLCRVRIGSWLRSARKEKKVINRVLWDVIQVKFCKEIRDKLKGEDVTPEEKISVKIAEPGEIRREYEFEMEKEKSSIRKEREAEAKASELVIKKLLEEEQNAIKVEQEKLRLDEEIARRLTVESNKLGPSCSQVSKSTPKKSSLDKYLKALNKKKQEPESTEPKVEIIDLCKDKVSPLLPSNSLTQSNTTIASKNYTSTIMCQSRDKVHDSLAYKHILLAKTLGCERAESTESDSGDSIKQEMRYFKPIRLEAKSKLQGNGKMVRVPACKPRTKCSSEIIRSPQNKWKFQFTSHPSSAFVRTGSGVSTFTSRSSLLKPQPSIVSEDGKVIKQYYNKKRNAIYASSLRPCTITSSDNNSQFLGFVPEHDRTDITILNSLIQSLSESYYSLSNRAVVHSNVNVNKVSKKVENNIQSKTYSITKRKSVEKLPKKLNGFLKQNNVNKIDAHLQEQLDFEFAKRLHDELNNPRHTRTTFQNKKQTPVKTKIKSSVKTPIQTRSSPRKRQITLDEFIPSKKFKL